MAIKIDDAKVKVYRSLSETANKFHFSPLDEGVNGKLIHRNLVLMTLTYLLGRNAMLMGEPGWGKTTMARSIASRLSGLPYDLYESVEIRGNPQKFEEKITGRLDFSKLHTEKEVVIWQGSFGVDVLFIDEANRLEYGAQDALLAGIDTGRWTAYNSAIYEGKKPVFLTINERTGYHQNGLIPALKDRLDIVAEAGYFTTMSLFEYDSAKKAVAAELCNEAFTTSALDSLSRSFTDYKSALKARPMAGHLTYDEVAAIRDSMLLPSLDNDGMLFLQAFTAEVNYSAQYGCKRSGDPTSPHTHDKNYAGVNVMASFSPRSMMAAEAYAKGLAWLLNESPTIDHVKFVLPHVIAHKAEFTDDYTAAHGQEPRTDMLILHLAKTLVADVAKRYIDSIQPMKNLIARLQKKGMTLTAQERQDKKVLLSNGSPVSLKPDDHDHPLMKDFVTQALDGDKKAFYEVE